MKTPSNEYGIMPLSTPKGGHQDGKDSEHLQSTTTILSEGRILENCEETRGGVGAKGVTSWSRFVSMLLCQLAGAESLREICTGLSCCLGKLRHLGVLAAPNKSTLSYANKHRPAEMFEELFMNTLARFRALGELGPGRHEFRFKNQLYSMNATVISLCLSKYGWCLSLMAAALRWNLFVYRELREWLDDPTAWNVEPSSIVQLNLPIPGIGQQIG